MTTTTQQQTWTEIRDAVSEADAKARVEMIAAAFQDRLTFERRHHPENETKQAKIAKAMKRMTTHMKGKVCVATGIDGSFVNAEINDGARFNIYAIDKLNDLMEGLTGTGMSNAVNRAVLASLKRFAEAGVAFTGTAAQAAASDKLRVDKAWSQLLVRHTVSTSTAPTQASSTMAALRELGVVRNTGTTRAPDRLNGTSGVRAAACANPHSSAMSQSGPSRSSASGSPRIRHGAVAPWIMRPFMRNVPEGMATNTGLDHD